MYYVYILHSELLKRHYTGFSEYRGKRRRQHIAGHSDWSRRATDWKEVFCRKVKTRAEARALEKKIKARGAKRFLDDLK